MPNRIIKESICTSESINTLTWFEEVFWYRLIVTVDDYGRMDARPAILKARLFPLKDRVTLKDVSSALSKLAGIGCVSLYEYDGKPYLYLPAWLVHQTPRAKESKYPAPDCYLQASENKCKQMQASENKCKQMQASENKCKQMQADEIICKHMQADEIICKHMQADAPDIRYSIFDNRYSKSDKCACARDALADEVKKVFLAFIDHRKKLKAPMTDHAIALMVKKLNTLSEDPKVQVQILERSIERGWKGIFPLDNPASKPERNKASQSYIHTDYEDDELLSMAVDLEG